MLHELFQRFSSSDFMPHGMCLLWRTDLLLLHVVSDTLIAISYYSIPAALAYFVSKRKDLQYSWMFVLFAIFILACGTTHIMGAWIIWHPDYWLEGVIKAMTAVTSIGTAILLWPLIPKALKLASPAMLREANLKLQEEIAMRMSSEAALRVSEERWKFALEGAGDGVWDWNLQSGEIFYSPRCDDLLSAAPEALDKDFLAWDTQVHPEDFPPMRAALSAHIEGNSEVFSAEFRTRCGDDEWKWIHARGKVVDCDSEGKATRMIGTLSDITARKRADESMQLATLVYRYSSEAMMVTDPDGTIISVNPAFTQLTGYSEEDVIGENPRILKSGRHDLAFYQAMWRDILATGHWEGEIWEKRKNGDIYAKSLTINTAFGPDGSPYRRVAMFSDITEKKKTSELIWTQANYDPLTGLPNRHMFHDRLYQEIKKSHRAALSMALLFIDLDHFKEINDTLGHDMGDILLKEASQRLASCVRETDTIARLGGDEFTIILGELSEAGIVDRVIKDILQKIAEPFQLGDETAYISASIGITLYPDDSTDADELVKHADQAMYVAKHHGRNRYHFFTPALQAAAQTRMRLINDLRYALSEDQFLLYYQPIVDLTDGRIYKAEALLRWRHPSRGLVSPAEFIPIAEETGLISDIGNWVFIQAAHQVACWRDTLHAEFQISINKSPAQFYKPNDPAYYWVNKLRDMGLPGDSMAVEITEGLLMASNKMVIDRLLDFRDSGIQVTIDDFGTGYSSLSYLQEFDIDYLKIDQSFVRNLAPNSKYIALCEAIIVMAHKLGIKVIAEGVETQIQRDLLCAAGCDYAQGFWFSRALPAAEFEQFLATDL